ncbi:class I SAM-dependent rRNA methyltransferase [Neolewinella persica]|uniref:class I SAM-dependent rRNA methyltransferase n=1 Tax=Neolewinella persica TaxID=70998 RepID=UPI000476EF0F|nr:class I SAM-dependent rRNA methyltransferase [Neolewinella persica]
MKPQKTNRLPVTLTAAGERALKSGHPWLFDGAIAKMKGDGKAGDLAVIFSFKKNKFIGVGLYDPDSPIRIRVLHQGSPVQINTDFFRARTQDAKKGRRALLATDTNGYRLLHGENDGFPGLVTDVYAGVAVIKVYSPVWFPFLQELIPVIVGAAEAQTAVLRLSRNVEKPAQAVGYTDGQVVFGTLDKEDVIFREHGLQFVANVIKGHKTGFFLDHRDNRRRVGELSDGQEVLDVFSYAGGFSVHALGGGATRVISLDISAPALAMARRNVALNFGEEDTRHEVLAEDAFVALERLRAEGQSFGIVIVDPPSFAKREKEVPGALEAYRRVNRLAIPLVAPGGILLAASCSARVPAETFFGEVEKVLRASGRTFTLLARTFHDVDHPIGFPEGAYLKSGYYRLG